jgi:hypothetical protein
MSCGRRAAIYRHKKRKQRGKYEQVCATCMNATWMVFGDKPGDYQRINWEQER